MTKDVRVKITRRQALVLCAILKPYAEVSPLMRDTLQQVESAIEYRDAHPSSHKQRRVESRKHLQRSSD